MIKYALQCAKGHAFDGWFRSSSAYGRQVSRKLVACPHCGVTQVEKQPMAPALVKKRSKAGPRTQAAPDNAAQMASSPGETRIPTVEVMRAFKRHLLENSENVGPRFSDEARKIHYGEADSRAIHGEASREEAIKLHEEGVEFGIIPALPEEQN